MSNDSVIQQCIQFAQQNPMIEVLWLYGSRAKGSAQANSDYDLAAALTSGSAKDTPYYLDEVGYQWAQETQQAISIVDINQVPTPLAYNVINEGLVVICKNPLRLHAEQARVWSLWEAFKYEHQKNRV